MRVLVSSLAFALVIGGLSGARAETRVFIIANYADGYGVDRCLASGAGCGNAVAAAYCHARDYKSAASFRKVDRRDITGAVPNDGGLCRGATCEEFVAIECVR